jgi:phosphoribosylformylglycinamidine synthase subunit PurL
MTEACTALSFPVVSGNVSLYNETNGVAIPPTPAIGGIGLLPDIGQMATIALKQESDALILLGAATGHLGQSLYMEIILDKADGAPPPVDLQAERRIGDFVRRLIRDERVNAAHDVSDGGLLVAIAEMALAGGFGATLEAAPETIPAHAFWFGEEQGRYIVTANAAKSEAILEEAKREGLPASMLGRVEGDAIQLAAEAPVPLAALGASHEAWLPRLMGDG